MNTRFNDIRPDHRIILGMIEDGASVLDLGCSSGDLLSLLTRYKNITGRGIEIDEQAIHSCVEKGLSVFHGDIDSGISDYADKSFDFVILNQTLQQVKHLENVLAESLRIGKHVIVGFPNFAYYKSRFQIFFTGNTPITPSLPYSWYSTPNLHFFSVSDFNTYCMEKNFPIIQRAFLAGDKKVHLFPNAFADTGIYLLAK